MSEPLGNSNEWRTPDALFDACNAYYGPFDVDVAAARWNYRCEKYFTKRDNGLKQRWAGRVWCNPPYSRGNLMRWTRHARIVMSVYRLPVICMLVPAYTSERWWHENVLAMEPTSHPELHAPEWRTDVAVVRRYGIGSGFQWRDCSLVTEVLFVQGRLRFRHKTGKQDSARHPSAVVVFSKPGVIS